MFPLAAHIKTSQVSESARRQVDGRKVPAEVMMPRIMLIVATFLLVMVGLVMVFSASTVETISQGESIFSYVRKQFIFALVGGAAAFFIAKFIPYREWLGGGWFWLLWGGCIALLCAVPFIGTEILGAKRWILIGGISIQPTEFLKIALVVAGANVLYQFKNEIISPKQMAMMAMGLVLGPLALMFLTQSDMGSAIIILMGLFSAMWLGEVPLRVMIPMVVVTVALGTLAIAGYRADRVNVWLNPWNDGEGGYGIGYQMIRSFYAFSEGGIFGEGLGNSREKFLYLPEAETDFIFSIIGEELGLVGAVFVVLLFVAVLYSGLAIARFASDHYGCILAGSLTTMLVGQAFLNIACATGLFPVTGKPLPFISSGGSSVIASLIMVGIILSVSMGSDALTPYERRRNNLNVIRVEHGDDSPMPPVRGEGSSRRSLAGLEEGGVRPSRERRPSSTGGRGGGSTLRRSSRMGCDASSGGRSRSASSSSSSRVASGRSRRGATSSERGFGGERRISDRVDSRDSRRSENGRNSSERRRR